MTRQAQSWQQFVEHHLPTRKSEKWKYADLSSLAAKRYVAARVTEADGLQDKVNQHRLRHENAILMLFVNGHFMSAFSERRDLPKGLIACGIDEAIEKHPALVNKYLKQTMDTSDYPFASLNAANTEDGLFLHVPEGCVVDKPVHMLSIVDDENEFITHPRHLLVLGANSQMTLIEEYHAFPHQAYMTNTVMNLILESGARLSYFKLQNEGRKAVHIAHTFVGQHKDSSLTYTNFSTGGEFARDELRVLLNESGTEFKAAGFYHLCEDGQYIDHHLDVNHLAPHSNSEMLYKGIVDNKSRAVFNGRLYVEKDAQKILAYQANHNLLLSNTAEVYSKPELEIYADDVKCKHGASIGQIDQDALFYLCSRGIAREEAMTMLLQGFAEEIINRVVNPALRARVMEMLP